MFFKVNITKCQNFSIYLLTIFNKKNLNEVMSCIIIALSVFFTFWFIFIRHNKLPSQFLACSLCFVFFFSWKISILISCLFLPSFLVIFIPFFCFYFTIQWIITTLHTFLKLFFIDLITVIVFIIDSYNNKEKIKKTIILIYFFHSNQHW